MGYNLKLATLGEETHVSDLCTNGGFSGLCRWIESLPAKEYPSVREIADRGFCVGSDRLAIELEDAFRDHRPKDNSTAHTVDHLLDLLGRGRPGEVASVVP